MTYIWAKIDIKFEETSDNMSLSAFLTPSNTWPELAKSELAYFLLILMNLSSNKSPFNQYYPKSVPNPDILIILLPKNDKIVVLANILFLTIFPINVNQLHSNGGADFRPRIFFKPDCHYMFKSQFCNLHEVSYKI